MNSAFIEPLDTLSFRGNRLFGDAGSWGETQMPPPPSVVAGALRSLRLVQDGAELSAFAGGQYEHPELGSRDRPGSFMLTECLPARRQSDGRVEPLFPLPADLVPGSDGLRQLRALKPHDVLCGSRLLPLWPVLAEDERAKPGSGRWLTLAGFREWQAGQVPGVDRLVNDSAMWDTELRVGVALQAQTRRADDGKLFSVQAVACRPGVGLAVRVRGSRLSEGMLRLGGDGRGALLQRADIDWPQPDLQAIARSGRARLVLTSPGIFPRGWLPTGSGEADALRGAPFQLAGLRARIVCAVVPRQLTVSGFDLARWQPKPAERAVPAGAVYWLDEIEAAPAALAKLVEDGLWPADPDDAGMDFVSRRAEGFNRCALGVWSLQA